MLTGVDSLADQAQNLPLTIARAQVEGPVEVIHMFTADITILDMAKKPPKWQDDWSHPDNAVRL